MKSGPWGVTICLKKMEGKEAIRKDACQVEAQLNSACASLDRELADSFALAVKERSLQLEEARRSVGVFESVEIVERARSLSEKDQQTSSRLALAYCSLNLGDEDE